APEIRAPQNALAGLTDQEKQELLEAEQEKIIKENQRKRDEWKEKIEQANSRVRELNSRFADWYYISPESTYTQLQIRLDDLIQRDAAASAPNAATGGDATTLPQFNFGQ